MQISKAAREVLWAGWQSRWLAPEHADREALRTVLGDIVRRAFGRTREWTKAELDELERSLWECEQAPRVYFECSMLQTAYETAEGVVKWRDMRCDDEDDYKALWSRKWLDLDFGKGDDVLLLPHE